MGSEAEAKADGTRAGWLAQVGNVQRLPTTLHYHTPKDRRRCAGCGEGWPCGPLWNAAGQFGSAVQGLHAMVEYPATYIVGPAADNDSGSSPNAARGSTVNAVADPTHRAGLASWSSSGRNDGARCGRVVCGAADYTPRADATLRRLEVRADPVSYHVRRRS